MSVQLTLEELFTVDKSKIELVKDAVKELEKPSAKKESKWHSDTKDTQPAKARDGLPVKLCGYDRWEAVSSFHKELRRGDKEQATYWLQVLLDGGMGESYVANYLWWISGEELAISEVHGNFGIYLGMLNTHGKKADPYQLYYAVMEFCDARKWWEDDESILMRDLWAKNAKAIKEKDTEEMLLIPDYALDGHTRKGKALMKDGKADLRYSGCWQGMIWRQKAMEQFGTILIPWEDVKWEPGELEEWEYMEKNIC